ncbi:MAG: adenosylcobinamide-GDP ribazoletransferase [Pseudomonadota bacterium]
MRDEGAAFLLALQFLTRLPVASGRLYSEARMAASVRYYPLVGVLVGCVSAGALLAATAALPGVVGVLLAVAAGLLVTGAFHEDGLADTFDGIGGGHTRAQALKIMRDSRLGTYGTAAMAVALALKVAALAALPAALGAAALVAGHGLSRLSSVAALATSGYVRGEGAGKPVSRGASAASLAVALATGAVILAGWSFAAPPIALAWGCAGLALGHGAMRAFYEPKLGGYTGDTLGAVQQASEIGFYLGLAAWL